MKDKVKNGWFVGSTGLVAMTVILAIVVSLDMLSAKVAAQTTPVYTFIQHDGVVIECIA
jgi:hypothetical protein